MFSSSLLMTEVWGSAMDIPTFQVYGVFLLSYLPHKETRFMWFSVGLLRTIIKKTFETIMGKEENVAFQHFLLFQHCFLTYQIQSKYFDSCIDNFHFFGDGNTLLHNEIKIKKYVNKQSTIYSLTYHCQNDLEIHQASQVSSVA